MPPAPPATAPFAARQRYRRSRMASIILFIFALIVLGSLPLGLQDLPTLYSLAAVSVVTFIALLFNRGVQVYVSGALLTGVMSLALLSVILAGRNGKIDVDYLQLYYLLVITELIAAVLLPIYCLTYRLDIIAWNAVTARVYGLGPAAAGPDLPPTFPTGEPRVNPAVREIMRLLPLLFDPQGPLRPLHQGEEIIVNAFQYLVRHCAVTLPNGECLHAHHNCARILT